MDLIFPVLGNILLVILLYLLDKRTSFGKLNYWTKQLLFGILFGGMAVFASDRGFAVLETVANVRDAAPISAGLIFGAPAGIISGVIGGLYRWFSVYWGAGIYTQLACSIACVLAGLMAAGMRKFMFDNKKPTWFYGVAITVVCEVVHMLLIFLTNMNDSSYAFEFVKRATLPMVIGNTLAVGTAVFIASLLSRETLRRSKGSERIAQTFQRWLLICIVVAYLVTSIFTYALQNGMARLEAEEVITLGMEDVYADINDASDENLLSLTEEIKSEYETNPSQPLPVLTEKYDVSEINLINAKGIITDSTTPKFIGYDMASGEQSSEFLALLHGEKSYYVQKYGPTSYHRRIYRKYAGIALADGGFIQVGYDAARFQRDIDSLVISATRNRHIGQSGFLVICDEAFRIVTDRDDYAGKSIIETGLWIDPTASNEKTIYETKIMGTPYLFAYTSTEGYYIIGAMTLEEAMFMRDASFYTSVFMQILIFAALFVFIYFLIKKVIINNLRKVNHTLSKIAEGNLNVVVDVRSNEEFASLSDDINSTVATLKRDIAEAAARIDKELEYAKQIQLSALPSTLLPHSGQHKFGICAQMIAAREVGGDFYDFYMLDKNTVAFLVADVSGKGIPAAMFMMTAKTILKDLAESGLPVNDIFGKANDKLCENNESGMFVTAWMGILDLLSGKLQYANAGHNPPLVLQNGGEFAYLEMRAGFVLAGLEGVRYRVGEMTLAPGDRVFLYTDGVTEATDAKEQLYGDKRLIDYMNRHKTVPAKALLHGLKTDIDAFVGDAPQFDDITMLMFDYYREEAGDNMVEKTFPAEESALADVLEFVESELERVQCPIKTATAVCVAIEEVFINIARYAYGGETGEVKLTFRFDAAARISAFELEDKGVPFDPLRRVDPDITLSAEERQIGGLGIFIAKKTMDTLSYRYENGKNILTMTKKI